MTPGIKTDIELANLGRNDLTDLFLCYLSPTVLQMIEDLAICFAYNIVE